MPIVVGIDLGTTNSCVAVHKDNTVKIIETKQHKRTLPSFVYYGDKTKLIVGEQAIRRAAVQPHLTIYDSKRIIGCKFNEENIKLNLKLWPFKVIEDDENECKIIIPQDNDNLKIRPEDVSAAILNELKDCAEDELEQKIVDVVITVPAYFTDAQKTATKDAAKIAGLNVLKLIPEPTAAALAFLHNQDTNKKCNILVYDLGGGTFDVSLLNYSNGKAKVLGVSGDYNLGGRDFDQRLLYHILKELETTQEVSLEGIKMRRLKRRLEQECENIKITLSSTETADFELFELEDKSIHLKISRKSFEDMNEELFKRTISILDELLSGIKFDKTKIDEILMVGGSTRIPKIEQLVKSYFDGKEVNKTVNPDEAVAIGAAIQAAQLSDHPSQKCKNYKMNDVTPYSYGIQVKTQDMNVIIKRNTQIPCKVEKDYYTYSDNQEEVMIRIFEGESTNVKENKLLGELCIFGITPKPRGDVKIRVQFSLHNDDGILKITATENSKKLSRNLNITLTNGRMSDEEIVEASQRMMLVDSVRA